MNNIEWKDGVVCYAYKRQWFFDGSGMLACDFQTVKCEAAIIMDDFQLNEIRTGDFIPASELDTEQKYNEVVEVFGLFGAKNAISYKSFTLGFCNLLLNGKSIIVAASNDAKQLTRQLTYHQIIAIGKLKRMMLERAVPAVEFGVVADNGNSDQVKNPTHYQLVEGVESIEIVARSMTKEQFKGYCLGNMLKYRLRAGKKDALQQDIAKADFYGDLYEIHKEKCYD